MADEKPPPKLPASLTVTEVMAATKLSEKAIRRRIERGQLRKLKGRDGKIRVPRADLEATGLVPTPGGTLRGVGELGSLEPSALLDRIVDQAEELGRLKALPERVESVERQLEAEREAHDTTRQELFRVQSEAESAAARSRRWWQRG